MATIFHVERVKYECVCGEWWPLCRLFYCRHCSEFRCSFCSANEIDCTFCGTCLENVPVGEARLRKNVCINCHQCPICGERLKIKKKRAFEKASTLASYTNGEDVHLNCVTCRWSTFESDIQTQTTATNWKAHENPYEEELTAVLNQMKNHELNDKTARDYAKRRLVGSRLSDRFGLQTMYRKRKAAMEKPTWLAPEHLPTNDVSKLPEDYFTRSVDLRATLPLEARLRQPLCGGGAPRPVHIPLKARRMLRCVKCDHNLSKLEYSPSSILFKIQTFARNFVPDIRLSRETELIPGSVCPVFLSISNESAAKSDVCLIADNDETSVECERPVVELSLPSRDDTADFYPTSEPAELHADWSSDVIVFRKRHRVGIRLDVKAPESRDVNQLRLVLKWKNELTAQHATVSGEWRQTRMMIRLGKS